MRRTIMAMENVYAWSTLGMRWCLKYARLRLRNLHTCNVYYWTRNVRPRYRGVLVEFLHLVAIC